MIDSLVTNVTNSGFVERLGWVLLHSLWQFALIAIAAFVCLCAMKRASAASRYLVLCGMLFLIVAAPVVTWMISAQAQQQSTLAESRTAGLGGFFATSSNEVAPSAPEFDFEQTRTAAAVVEDAGPPVDTVASSKIFVVAHPEDGTRTISVRDRVAPWLNIIVSVWCVGVLLFSLRPAWSWWAVRRLRTTGVSEIGGDLADTFARLKERMRISGSVRVLQSTLVKSPIVVGCFRSVILLPASLVSGMPVPQLESILAHELAHVRRYDYLINLLQTCVETVFFYHPAVWWVSRRMRIERENCCDDVVVRVLGDRVEYGRALLAIEESRRTPSALALSAKDGSLLCRVRRILSPEQGRAIKSSPLGVLTLAAACLLVVVCGTALRKDAEAK